MELTVIKKAIDYVNGEKVLRISIGGFPDKAYITYRGSLHEVKKMLADVTRAFDELEEEPSISPDGGKKYA